jgi:hypothetical protein
VKCAGVLLAIATVSACGGSSATVPLLVSGRPVTAARMPNAPPRYTTIVPDQRGHRDFEYVFNDYDTYASIFDYPKGVAQIGSIYGDGGQGCTNVLYGYGNKYFWNIGGITKITEYKVPRTPIKTLSDPSGFPSSCAMNTMGDLAVGILYASGAGSILIYKHASGSGTLMSTPLDEEFFDGYDDKGNLFADGFTGNRSGFALVELPKGSKKFVKINTSNTVQFPGSVQWDGKYLTVFDQTANAMYQYTVSGKTATLKNTIQFTGSSDCAQTWIVKGLVYCADAGSNDGEVFKYPAGGAPIATFTGNFDVPLGVVAVRN